MSRYQASHEDLTRITSIPIFLRSCSGYFKRAFSASCFVLKGSIVA